MNEMYDMSIVAHNYGVMGILLVVFVNLVMLYKATNLKKYKKSMSVFTPIFSTAIGTIIFTGTVMMAAKHLDFTLENIIMIFFAVLFIIVEVKRSKTLKYLDDKDESALAYFRPIALKLYGIEIFLTLSMAIWMWL